MWKSSRFFHRLSEVLTTSEGFFVATLVSYGLLTMVFENKPYLYVVILFGFMTSFATRLKIDRAVLLLSLFVLPFEKGLRSWLLPVVGVGSSPWETGYNFYFGLSVKLFVAIALLLLLIGGRKRLSTNTWADFFLVAYFIWTAVGLFAADVFTLGVLGFVRLSVSVVMYFAFRFAQRDPKLISQFFVLLLAQGLFLALVGALQFWHQAPLNLFMEDAIYSRAIGFFTTDGEPLFRVSGLLGHPTYFANYCVMLFFLLVGYGFHAGFAKYLRPVWLLTVCLLTVVIFATLSRSSYLALSVGILVFAFFSIVKKNRRLKLSKNVVLTLTAVVVTMFFVPAIASRLQSITTTTPNVHSRLQLLGLAQIMATAQPWFGVGLNHFTLRMSNLVHEPTLRSFLYPVHNTFALIFSESGIPAGLLFIGFIASFCWKQLARVKQNYLSLGVLMMVAAFVINAQFHALFNQDPSFDLLLVAIGFAVSQNL